MGAQEKTCQRRPDCGNVLSRKDKPRCCASILAERTLANGADLTPHTGSKTIGEYYHMDHIKQPSPANKRGAR